MTADRVPVSRASDPLAATASRDARVQVLAAGIATHFAQLTPEGLARAVPGALRLLAEYAEVDIAFAALVDHDRLVEVWEWAADGVDSAPPRAGWTVDRAFGAGAQVLRRGIAIPIPDAGLLAFDAETTERFARTDVGSLALVPVRRQDELVGVVGFLTSGRKREWRTETITQLDVFGDLLLSAVLRVRFQADLAVADARVRRISDLVPDALLFVGEDDRITWASRSAVTVLARTPENLLGRRPGELVHPDERDTLRDALRMARDGAALPPLRCQVEVGDGYRWCEISASHADDGGVTAPETLLSVRDTHESQLEAERLASSAATDHLTGALNRAGLRELLAGHAARGTPLALAFCDLDGFKQVNDRHGHQTGDAVLVEVAARLRQAARAGDALARIGGDEFVVVLTGVDSLATAGPLAERLVRAIAGPDGELSPVGGAVLQVPLSLSVGVAVSERELSSDALLQRADTAMYEAKRQGKNRWAGLPA